MSPHLWRPVQAGGRTPFVTCIGCRARELNEHNRLKRGQWQETSGGQRLFRCGACSEEVIAPGGGAGHEQAPGRLPNDPRPVLHTHDEEKAS